MGRGADVKQMIAAADKNGDGKVWSMFCLACTRGECSHSIIFVSGGSVKQAHRLTLIVHKVGKFSIITVDLSDATQVVSRHLASCADRLCRVCGDAPELSMRERA